MTGPIPTSSMAALNMYDSVAPRGLSVAQQREIAAAQAQTAAMDRTTFRPQSRSFPSSASLYVGELDPNVQESTLYDIFNAIAPVDSVRVCRDSITNRSLGYAFVNFKTHVDGERALQALNSTLINGKPCRVMWSQRDLAKRKISGGNIFVKNLDPSITSKSLRDTFAHYGFILSCKVVTDPQGQSKGYGFVHYDTIEAAENAIQQVNGTTVFDRELYVGHHIPKRERQQHQQQNNHHHHNNNNNSNHHNHHHLNNHNGTHHHTNHTNNGHTNHSNTNGHHHHHHPPPQQTKFTNVYVKNLMPDIKEEELKELFGGFGPIISVLIQRDEGGNSKGFGFVNFEHHEDAERAVQQMNETEYIGRRLYVSRAQKKSEREENKHHHNHHTSPYNNNNNNNGTNNNHQHPNSSQQPQPQPQQNHFQSTNAFQHHHHPSQHQNQNHPTPPPPAPPHSSSHHDTNHNSTTTSPNHAILTTPTNTNNGTANTTSSGTVTKNNRYQGMNLYIKNLDDEVTDQRLRDEFTKYGTITSAKVMREEKTGQSKGFGFVCFSNAQDATKAVTEMNGKTILSKSIYVALAQRKEDRRHHTDPMTQRNNQLHLQQPFMPMPGYIPGAPMYYEYSNFPPQPDGRPPRYQGPYIKQGYPVPVHAAYYMTPPSHPHPHPRPPMYTTTATATTTTVTTAPSTPTTTATPVPAAMAATATTSTTAVNTTTTVQEENTSNLKEDPPPLTMDMLTSYSDETQNQILGERIYAVVQAKYSQLAGKVTGMLLEMDKEDLISLINDRESLESKADEAVNVLEQHRASQTTEE